MKILLTGPGGFLGSHLIPRLLKRGEFVYSLYHKAPEPKISPPCQVLIGDITKPGLGLENAPPDIDQVIHCAALLDLGNKHQDEIWKVNVIGTENVLDFCQKHDIPKLVFCSTAYTHGRNTYERSKERCEDNIIAWGKAYGLKVIIFKLSIIIGSPESSGTDQTINHVALCIARVHRKAETARRKVQDTLALPPLELGFRVRGIPQATLNVIPVELVADEIVSRVGAEGTFFITNPNPPLLEEVADEVGEALGLNIHILKAFKPSPPERMLEKLISPFLPYMQGEPQLPTVVNSSFRLEKGYITNTVKAFLKA